MFKIDKVTGALELLESLSKFRNISSNVDEATAEIAGVLLAIPVYTLLFGWWNAFFPERKHWWTYIIPWLGFMMIFYLHVASGRDWDFQIISVDEYMLGGWLAPMIGRLIQALVARYIDKTH